MKNNKLVIVHDSGFNGQYKSFLEKLNFELEFIDIKSVLDLYRESRKKGPKVNRLVAKSIPNTTEHELHELIRNIDLGLFTGGADVSPDLYGEPIGMATSINQQRDIDESDLFELLWNKPKLGICRGSQFLTVKSGGRLIQHVENHTHDHYIDVNNIEFIKYTKKKEDYIPSSNIDRTLTITSTHHQMMFPYNLKKNNYTIIGWSKKYRSNVYLDGNNKQIDVPENFLEPEIVYYNTTNSLCIQGHPEYGHCPEETQKYCLSLIKKLL